LVSGDGGTCAFQPPETHDDEHRPLPLDVWGLGVSIMSVVCGHLPFPGITTQGMKNSVKTKEPNYWGVEVSEELRSLIADLLQKDPERRPTI